jgi:hypothetical protein
LVFSFLSSRRPLTNVRFDFRTAYVAEWIS